ncbi:MFS transporter [Corynebacterium bovis]|uniref:MFS transporter n=1 Tax=Corynebacterium bovis TaxID=36808 RepID=UPI0031395C7B
MTTAAAPAVPPVPTGPAGPATPTLTRGQHRRILASSFIGTMIEYYDFVLYATCASIVFNKIFFTNLSPGMALFASFASLAVGYFLRPVGGVFFGHFGDRLGRKKMLVITLMAMGTVTLANGFLPTQAQIGLWAPLLLILMRMVQGFAVGGEWGGAMLMTLEHAPRGKRGFAAAFAEAGGPAGAISATLMLSLMTWVAGDGFLSWGWRVPFLLSFVLVVACLVIRAKVAESPVFESLAEKTEKRKFPLTDLLRNHMPRVLVTFAASLSPYVTQALATVWGVSMAVEAGEPRGTILNWKAAGAALTLVTTLLPARISDRIGRRKMLGVAGVSGVVLALPLTMLLGQGSVTGFAVAVLVGTGVIQGMFFGTLASYIGEMFPPAVRYTGSSVSYQTAASVGGGLTPMIAASLMLVQPGGLWWVGVFGAAVCAVSTAAVVLYRGGPADEDR